MEFIVHIDYPETGIEFSQLRKILEVFEKGCKLYCDTDLPFEEGKILKVKSGSIWLEVVLPIAIQCLPQFFNFLREQLANRRAKKRIQIKIEDENKTIKIEIEEKK